jgi:predicted site-specific integrase-resolvase
MEDLIPLGEVVRLLDVTRPAVLGMVRRGELHRVMTPVGRYGYHRAEVEALAARRAELYERGPKGWPRPRRAREALSA